MKRAADRLVRVLLAGAVGCEDPCADGALAWMEDGTTWGPGSDTAGDYDQETIRLADGDVANVCPGDWEMEIDVVTDGGESSVVGAGAGSTTFVRGRGQQVFYTIGSGHLTVRDLSIRGGVMTGATGDGEPLSDTVTRGAGFAAGVDETTLDSVVIEDNQAAEGGGIGVGPGKVLTVRNSQIVGNRAEAGGGAALAFAGSQLISENTDWGTGADDNAPDDIAITGDHREVYASFSFGAAASFTCAWDTRTCD
ncbi:MAG: hypothetical protein Q8P41_12820 [Pseudomonadota bacterium]|nr:hypothetical protein [Pseudomonadota bacterium]